MIGTGRSVQQNCACRRTVPHVFSRRQRRRRLHVVIVFLPSAWCPTTSCVCPSRRTGAHDQAGSLNFPLSANIARVPAEPRQQDHCSRRYQEYAFRSFPTEPNRGVAPWSLRHRSKRGTGGAWIFISRSCKSRRPTKRSRPARTGATPYRRLQAVAARH